MAVSFSIKLLVASRTIHEPTKSIISIGFQSAIGKEINKPLQMEKDILRYCIKEDITTE